MCGHTVLAKFFTNLFKGKFMDENLLMSLVGFGALLIGENLEAVAILIFYQIGELCQNIAVNRSRSRIETVLKESGGQVSTVHHVTGCECKCDCSKNKSVAHCEHGHAKEAQTERFITRFSKIYTPCVVGVGVIIAVIVSLIFARDNFAQWIYIGLTFLVISCPCALVLSIPMSFSGGVGAASRRGILVKDCYDLEQLGKADAAATEADGVVLTGGAQLSTGIKIAKKTRQTVFINIIFTLFAKAAIMALAIILQARGIVIPNFILLVEFADIAIALIAILNAVSILRYNPNK